MTTTEEPRSPLEAVDAITPIVRKHADESEANATLARPVVEAMIDAGLLRQLTPRSLGGAETDPITWLKTVEAMARLDGSAGWCTWINGCTGMFGTQVPEAECEALYANPRLIMSGTFFPVGKAVAEDGGYRVTGRWPYGSGSKHATHAWGCCMVFDGDSPRMTASGPDLRLALAPMTEAAVVDTWEVSGLIGTGSHDIIFEDIFVPEAYAAPFSGRPLNRHYTGPLYRLPLLTVFGYSISAVALGIAQHAIDVMLEVAATKVPAAVAATDPRPMRERPLFHQQLSEAVSRVRSSRAWLFEAVAEAWDIALAGQKVDMDVRTNMYAAATNATRSSREAVELMYLAGGGRANYRTSPLQRCLRDIHAVSQHTITSPQAAQDAGAMLAGLPPVSPLLAL